MKPIRTTVAVLFALAGTFLAVGQQAPAKADNSALTLVQVIPMPGVLGRIDHFTVDAKRRRIIVSALGNDTVEVVDTFGGRVLHTIGGMSDPQGVAYAPQLDKIYVANEGDGTVRVLNGTTFQQLGSINFKENPDNVRYDSTAKIVYVGYGMGSHGAIGRIDATNDRRLDDIVHLDAHPESFQLETHGPKIFINIGSMGKVTVVDRNTKQKADWGLAGLKDNFPMALDEVHHRLFVGTREPARLVVLDTANGRIVAKVPTVADMDDLSYDAARGRIYVPGGAGFVSVIQQESPDRYVSIARVPSAIGARTAYWYAQRDKFYLAVPDKTGSGAQIWMYEAQTD